MSFKKFSIKKCGICCLKVLNKGYMMEDLNKTYVVLILNINSPKKVTDFRPVSLCNVVYKIIMKTLANRRKNILRRVISES